MNNENSPKKKHTGLIVSIVLVILLLVVFLLLFLLVFNKDKKSSNNGDNDVVTKSTEYQSEYTMNGNSLDNFDLYFLKLENKEENKIYSPLSIKYTLEMLSEGANGKTKKQIDGLIGDYLAKKYPNNPNMSFANALFVNEANKDSIKNSYTETLKNKYNAEVIYDSFNSPKTINDWVSNKTFKLINDLLDDVSGKSFVLVNALGINMEWKNKIQKVKDEYYVNYPHEEYFLFVDALDGGGYSSLKFNNKDNIKALRIGASINKYDIVKDIGEDKIRETVGKEYSEWLKRDECGTAKSEPDVNTYLNQYIKDLNKSYKSISSSTDFEFYDNDEVKIFAKDLKEYDGVTLQYVGIMPKKDKLDSFITNTNAEKLNSMISNLKEVKYENFEEGYITKIIASIPVFKFEYELNLLDDLVHLGIKDVFDPDLADLSRLTDDKSMAIDSATHKANIEFSNDGIKASAATTMGGKGAYDCSFDYLYKVPVKEIDLSFDNPYLFLIRDKKSEEVWFIGTVYEPTVLETNSYYGYY